MCNYYNETLIAKCLHLELFSIPVKKVLGALKYLIHSASVHGTDSTLKRCSDNTFNYSPFCSLTLIDPFTLILAVEMWRPRLSASNSVVTVRGKDEGWFDYPLPPPPTSDQTQIWCLVFGALHLSLKEMERLNENRFELVMFVFAEQQEETNSTEMIQPN